MRLRCSACGHVGNKNDFLRPSDIIPPNYCICPNCEQTNEDFYIVKEEDELKWVVKLLCGLEEKKLKELLKVCALIADPLSQELIKKASENE